MLSQLFKDFQNFYIQIKNVYKLWKQFSKIHDLFITGSHTTPDNNSGDGNIHEKFQKIIPELETFKNMVFETIIPRNIRLSESPSYGIPAILHDAESKGAISYLNLAKEIVRKNGLLLEI